MGLILRSERRDRRSEPIEDVVVLIGTIEIDERNRRVVRMVLLEAEHALPEPVVAAQRLGARLGRLDQILDDRGRNVVAVECRVERRFVAARFGEKQIALQDRVVQRRIGVDVRLVQPVQLDECLFAIGLVAVRRQDRPILTVGQRDVAGRQPHGRVLDVGCRKRRIGIVRSR